MNKKSAMKILDRFTLTCKQCGSESVVVTRTVNKSNICNPHIDEHFQCADCNNIVHIKVLNAHEQERN